MVRIGGLLHIFQWHPIVFELAEKIWPGVGNAEEKSVLALMIQTPRMATRLT
jgi:hypothetical protein